MRVAPQLAAAVADWHERFGPHGGLGPDVVRLDEADNVYLLAPGPRRPEYLAPEQTGLLRCPVDERSDLYAVGVLLYQLATGRLPGGPTGSAGWIGPRQLVPQLPLTFDEIVVELLAMLPHQRYRGAGGLAADLRRCEEQMRTGVDVRQFLLGADDVVPRLRMSGRIYGRERILARLATIADRVRRTGQSELTMVRCAAGLGRTAVLDAFADEVAASGGLVVGGAFARDAGTPYLGIAQAVDQLVIRLLANRPQDRAAITARLVEAVGFGAGALCDLSPAFAALVNESAIAPEHCSAESLRHRLHLAVSRLLAAVAQAHPPLVVTLDDLHWADEESVWLLRNLLSDPNIGQVLLLVGFEWALPSHHPVAALLQDPRHRAKITELRLRPLPDSAIVNWLVDTFGIGQRDAAELGRTVASRTGSVPLAVVQFLHRLHEGGNFVFDSQGPRWRWRPDDNGEAGVDDLATTVHRRVDGLTTAGRELLRAAAVLGTSVDPDIAADAADMLSEDVDAAIGELVRRGFLSAIAASQRPDAGRRYRWTSEHLRLVLLAGLSSDVRARLFRACGRALRSAADHGGYPIGTVADYLKPDPAIVATETHRSDLASLNLTAGQWAWRLGAVAAAGTYLDAAAGLISDEDWRTRYDLAFLVHVHAALAADARGDRTRAQHLLVAAEQYADDDVDRARVQRVRALAAARRGDGDSALTEALKALDLLGVAVPASAVTTEGVDALIRRVLRRLVRRQPETVARARPATEPRIQLAAQVTADLLSPLAADTDRAALLAGLGVELCLRHGPTPAASAAFAAIAVSAAARLGDDTLAERCLHISARLFAHYHDPHMATRVLPAAVFVPPAWLAEPDESLDRVHEAYLAALEQGELANARALHVLYHTHGFVNGVPLDGLADRVAAAHRLFQFGDPADPFERAHGSLAAAVERLRSTATTPTGVAAEPAGVELAAVTPTVSAHHRADALADTARLAAACVLDEPYSGRVEDRSRWRTTMVDVDAAFYRALALTGSRTSGGPADPSSFEMDQLQDELDRWAERSPARYAHKAMLISAERARLAGDDTNARRRYDLAIEGARTHGWAHTEALAAERAAAYAADRGEARSAVAYLHRARTCYQRWNAHAKVQQLDRNLVVGTTTDEVDHLDLVTIANAVQTLSAEARPDQALHAVVELFVQHTSADRACLLVNDDERLVLAVLATRVGGVVSVTEPPAGTPLYEQVPLTVIEQVRATRRPLAVDRQALADLPRDRYLARDRPHALLCLPLSRGDRLIGVVYQEFRQQPPPAAHNPQSLRILCEHAAALLDQAFAARRLADVRQLLDAAFELLPAGLVLLGPDLTVQRASPNAARLTGLPLLPGTPVAELFDVFSPAGAAAPTYALELALVCSSGGPDTPHERTVTIVQPDGDAVRFHTTAAPVRRADGSLVGVLLSVADARCR
jgi:predicted ATPase